ncbi:hypothetical protein A6M21_01615 [Desulfotomaculum copahuensis]|uniref:Integrase n=2 Tax=Desulfotomaculum copahuensis TaxID=1838280 RepID=A0A1B7LAU6_9FIRM|nr:hypothetical protein A6M21_01615 [Desulfotomaculum copahuensis]
MVGGKRKKIWHKAGKSLKEAQKLRNELLHKLQTKTYSYSGKKTFKEFLLEKWLPDYAEVALKISTIEGYKSIISNHIIPCIGDLRMDRLSPSDIQGYIADRRRHGLSNRTILQHYRIIHQALDHAIQWELLATNPADRVRPPSFRSEKFKPVLPPIKEVIRILETLKNTIFYVPCKIAFYTGMRRGEILALKWSNVNFDEEAFIVNETIFPSENGLVRQLPKNETSIRVVAFPHSLASVLQEQKEWQNKNRLKFKEYYQENDLICCKEDGSPINPDSFSKRFGETLKRYDLPHIRFHDLRHLNVTGLIATGADLGIVQKQVGHSSLGTTLDYNHPSFHLQKKAVEALDNTLQDLR